MLPSTFFYVMQIRRSLLNEDENGFRKAKRPIYYDDGLEVNGFSLCFTSHGHPNFHSATGRCACYNALMLFLKTEDQADTEQKNKPTKFYHWRCFFTIERWQKCTCTEKWSWSRSYHEKFTSCWFYLILMSILLSAVECKEVKKRFMISLQVFFFPSLKRKICVGLLYSKLSKSYTIVSTHYCSLSIFLQLFCWALSHTSATCFFMIASLLKLLFHQLSLCVAFPLHLMSYHFETKRAFRPSLSKQSSLHLHVALCQDAPIDPHRCWEHFFSCPSSY